MLSREHFALRKAYYYDGGEIKTKGRFCMHTVVGLQEIALLLTSALLGGLILERFRQPAILGYISGWCCVRPIGSWVLGGCRLHAAFC